MEGDIKIGSYFDFSQQKQGAFINHKDRNSGNLEPHFHPFN